MQLCTIFFIVWLTCLTFCNADEPKIFCYFDSQARNVLGYARMEVTDIDPSLCTHLVYLSVEITDAGTVTISKRRNVLQPGWSRAGIEELSALRKGNEKLKTMVSALTHYDRSEQISEIAGDSSLRSKYVGSVVDFLLRYDFDGFDIRWEWPTIRGGSPDDVKNFVLLLKEFRERFNEEELILSVALEGLEFYATRFYDIPEISKYVDFILLDITCHQLSEPTLGHSSPLYPAAKELSSFSRSRNINATVHYWLNQGVPAEKLILGTRFYGLNHYFTSLGTAGPRALSSGPRGALDSEITYTEVCLTASLANWTSEWDEEQRVPYIYSEDQWISYDNVRSLTEKAQYVRAMGLGGVMVYSIDRDDRWGECGERAPLLKTLNRVLRGIGFDMNISKSNSSVNCD